MIDVLLFPFVRRASVVVGTVSLLIDCPRADMLFHDWLTALAQGEAGEEQQQGEARAQGAQPRDQAREGGRREANQRRASHVT